MGAEQLQAGVEGRWVCEKNSIYSSAGRKHSADSHGVELRGWFMAAAGYRGKRSSQSRAKAPCYTEYAQRELLPNIAATPRETTTKLKNLILNLVHDGCGTLNKLLISLYRLA